jgi:prepilin-type processing-associated H-X9-DG protein/prepilin-type N-terminal cleavage/methylation domain-containing protein
MPKRSAFTLVELLVVIGIIALLISILLPALNKARAAGLKVACASNMRQIGLAFLQYSNETKGRLPFMGYYGNAGGPWNDSRDAWDRTIHRYMGGNSDVSQNGVLTCPADSLVRDNPRTYAMAYLEAHQGGANVGRRYFSHGHGGGLQAMLVKARPSAETLLLVERATLGNQRGSANSNDCNNPGQQLEGAAIALHGRQFTNATVPAYGRYSGFNYLFCDGHVEFLDPATTVGRNLNSGQLATLMALPPGNQGWNFYFDPGGYWDFGD